MMSSHHQPRRYSLLIIFILGFFTGMLFSQWYLPKDDGKQQLRSSLSPAEILSKDKYDFDKILKANEIPIQKPAESDASANNKPPVLVKQAIDSPKAEAVAVPARQLSSEPPTLDQSAPANEELAPDVVYIVQLEKIDRWSEVKKLQQHLLDLGYDSVHTKQPTDGSGYRLRLGPYNLLRAQAIQQDLKQYQIACDLVALDTPQP